MAASRLSSDMLQLFWDLFRKRKIEGKKAPLRLQGSLERDTLIFIWPETISMDGFIREKWTSQKTTQGGRLQYARKTKTRFTNFIENEIASLGSSKTQFGLLVKFSIIRDLQTIPGPLFLQPDSSPL